ncbi:MAG: CBS domain-containing protein [Promethearchaeota archaeon]
MLAEREVTIKDIIEKDYGQLTHEDTVSKVLNLIVNQGEHVCIITDDKGFLSGVVRERDLIGKKVQPQTNMMRLLKSVPELTEETELLVAAERLFDSNSRVLPVVDKTGKVIGIITDVNLVLALLSEDIATQSVIEIAMEIPPSLESNESVSKAITILRNQGISRIPIMENGRVLSIFSTHDACSLLSPATRATDGDISGYKLNIKSEVNVGAVARPLVLIKPVTRIKQAIHTMIEQSVSSVLIGDENEIYGLLTVRDIIAHILQQNKTEKYIIQVSGAPDSDVRAVAFDRGSRIINRYQSFLGEGSNLHIRFKKIPYQSKRGMFRWKCQVRLITDRGHSFSASADEWGSEAACIKTIEKLDRIVLDERKYKIDSKRRIQRASKIDRIYSTYAIEPNLDELEKEESDI